MRVDTRRSVSRTDNAVNCPAVGFAIDRLKSYVLVIVQ